MPKQIGNYSLISIFLLFTTACSTHQLKVGQALKSSTDGNYEQAAASIQKEAYTAGKDQLAFLFDYALLQLHAGNYEESNKAFHLADEISEVKDYISIKDQGSSLIFGEGMMTYKGDDYEKILINSFSAINYALLDKPESALVEVRRLNDKLNKYAADVGREYLENPFIFYLSANLWEMESKWDDALIDYEKFYQKYPDSEYIKEDLLYASYKARNFTKLEKYKKIFSRKKYGKAEAKAKEEKAELLVIYFQGKGPIKQPNPVWFRIPKFYPQFSYIDQIAVEFKEEKLLSEPAVELSSIVTDALDKQYAGLIAKRLAGKIVKNQIAQSLEREDEGLGLLARAVMDISDQADLRQWLGLPNSIHILKLNLPSDTKNLSVHLLSKSVEVEKYSLDLNLQKGKKNFVLLRSYR